MASFEWPPLTTGSGTVTSVALADGSSTPIYTISGSPVVDAGTLTFTLSTEVKNKVFAGPTTGADAQPTFRSLVLADFPSQADRTVLGNVSGGAAVPVALTATQLTTLINSFTSSLSGAVPASGGGTTTFLRADGSFAIPPGTGVTAVSVASANGFAGSSSGGATPALTLSTSVTGILVGNGTSVATAVAGDFPTLNQNTTGTALNITASSNTSLTSLVNLATVGTIGTGTWNATAIAYAKVNLAASVKASDMNSQASAFGTVLTADGAGASAYSAIPDSATSYINGSIAAAVAANALTVSLKDKSGSTPSASSPASFSFRNATSTTGTYATVSVTGALSVVAPDAQSLGLTIGVASYLYVYAINNAGTVELALSASGDIDEGATQSTTAIASASSATTLYSTTARTGVAIRLIGRITITLGASTHWSNSPTEISNVPFRFQKLFAYGSTVSSNGTTTSATYATPTNNPTVTFVARRTGLYRVGGSFLISNSGATGNEAGASIAATSGSPTTIFQQNAQFTCGGANYDTTLVPYGLFWCTAGTSYTFTLQMKVGGGNTATLLSATANHILVAEEL